MGASLLLSGVNDEQWRSEIEQKNILQARSASTATSLAGFLRARLAQFDSMLWLLVRDGDRTLATQTLLAWAAKHSALLRDFMDLKLREEYRKFSPALPLIPGELSARFQTNFHADPADAVFKGLGMN